MRFLWTLIRLRVWGDLKDAIKAKKANALKNVGVRNLQLFLAKAADGEWLSSGLKIVKKLKKFDTL